MILFLLGLLAQTGLPYYNDSNLTPEWPVVAVQKTPPPKIDFTNQKGEYISSQDLFTQPTVICFFFTSCGSICPTILRHMNQLTAIGSAFGIAAISVMPRVDTSARLKQCAEKYGLTDPRWQLLSGDLQEVVALARDHFYIDGGSTDDKENAFIHSEKIYLLDATGSIRGVYQGTRAIDMTFLAQDIEAITAGERL